MEHIKSTRRAKRVVVVTPRADGKWAVLRCSREEHARIQANLLHGFDYRGVRIPDDMEFK